MARRVKGQAAWRAGDVVGAWTLVRVLGRGGNGEVWEVTSAGGDHAAMKFLFKTKDVAYRRFRDEVETVRKHEGLRGLLPVLDSHLPDNLASSPPWYVMPLATPIERAISARYPLDIIQMIESIATTLAALHERGVAHRDVKPGNIVMHGDVPCVSDFGLVDYPDKGDLTQLRGELGPKWTLAPEMRREAGQADGRPADVYSLAKTLWILLCSEPKSFDGQYNEDGSLGLRRRVPAIYSAPIDALLTQATDNDPSSRPSMREFGARLAEAVATNKNFRRKNAAQWLEIQRHLFPSVVPERAEWTDLDEVIAVLDLLAMHDDLNHMLFPDGGGLDLEGAELAYESECIILRAGVVYLVKPKRLIYESFRSDPQWNYFRLETHPVPPTDVYPEVHGMTEELVEIEPGRYLERWHWDEHVDEFGQRLPESARLLIRCLGGDLLFVQKTGAYNQIPETYSGIHSRVSTDEFRQIIAKLAKRNEGPLRPRR